jgi:hypothetical protein
MASWSPLLQQEIIARSQCCVDQSKSYRYFLANHNHIDGVHLRILVGMCGRCFVELFFAGGVG